MELLIVTRNATDKGRTVVLTAQLRQSASGSVPVDGRGAVGAAYGTVRVQAPQGAATEIFVVKVKSGVPERGQGRSQKSLGVSAYGQQCRKQGDG